MCRAGVMTASAAERRGGAQNRADIVRVGDLVEHHHELRIAELLKIGRGQRSGLEQDALMDGARTPAAGPDPAVLAVSGLMPRAAMTASRRLAALAVTASRCTGRAGLRRAASTVCSPNSRIGAPAPDRLAAPGGDSLGKRPRPRLGLLAMHVASISDQGRDDKARRRMVRRAITPLQRQFFAQKQRIWS